MPGLGDAVRDYRAGKLRAFMRAHGFDALAFTTADWFEWAGNHGPTELSWERPFLLVVPLQGHPFAFMSEHGRHKLAAERARGTLWIGKVEHYSESHPSARRQWVTGQWAEMVAEGLRGAGLERATVGVDALGAAVQPIAQARPEVRWKKAGDDLQRLRWVKHADEIATMRAAASLSDWAIEAYRSELRPGRLLAEADHIVSARLAAEATRRLPGANFIIQRLLTLSGPSSACPHGDGAPNGRVLQADTIANSTIATRLDGLAMELSRPWLAGRHDLRVVSLLSAVQHAQEAAIAAAVAGRPVSGIHAAAQQVLDKAGLGHELVLRAGHGIGVVMHDFPHDTPFNDRPLEAGEVFAIEPGLYLPAIGGFRFADTVLIGDGPAQSLTRAPKTRESLSLP